MAQHASEKTWWGDVDTIAAWLHATREEAAAMETWAIETYRPKCNVAGNPEWVMHEYAWKFLISKVFERDLKGDFFEWEPEASGS